MSGLAKLYAMMNELLPNFKLTGWKLILVLFSGFVIFTGLAVLLSFQGLQAIYPVLFIGIIVFLILKKSNQYSLGYLDLGFVILLVSEIITTLFSTYFYNSLSSLNRLVVLLFLFLLFREVLKVLKSRFLLAALFFGFCTVLLVANVISFFSFKTELFAAGFSEISNFKGYYWPLKSIKNGTLSNLWSSALLIFIPFNLIFLFKAKNRWLKLFVLGVLLINIFCLVVSFSRGVYLSLLFFILVINVTSFRIFGLKRLMLYNVVAFILVTSAAFLVKEPFMTTVSLNKTMSQQRSTEGRIDLWKNALGYVDDRPVFGYVQKNFRLAKENNPVFAEDVVFVNRTNNTYLQFMIERGSLGLVVYLVFFGLITFLVFKNVRSKARTKEEKIEIVLLFSGMLAFLFRELTFSSLFDSEIIYFLAFYLVFNLIPFDIEIKLFSLNTKQGRMVSGIGILFISALIAMYALRGSMVYYNNKAVEKYYANDSESSLAFINKALNVSPSDVELQKNKTIFLGKLCMNFTVSANNKSFLVFDQVDSAALSHSLTYLELILEKSPDNDEIHHNIGWVYFAMNLKEETARYFKRTVAINPYVGRFHVSLALYNLFYGNPEEAVENVGNALKYSPDLLESVFYEEFAKKYPQLASKSKQLAIVHLREQLAAGNSPIIKARLAKLLFHEHPPESYNLFCEVTTELPNLFRPWAYLGQLQAAKQLNSEASTSLRKALYLERSDYLPSLYRATFLKTQNQDNEAAGLFKNILRSYREVRYFAYSKNASIPKMKNIPIRFYNTNLLFYTKPKIGAEVFQFLAEYHRGKNETDNAMYYERLSEKYKNTVYKGDEKIP